MLNKSQTKRFIGSVAFALLVSAGGVAHAQQGGNGGNGGGRPNFQNMTPEQRQQFFQQMQDNRIKQQLTAAGFADPAVQDPIVAYFNEQIVGRQAVRDKATQLAQGLANNATNDEVGIMLRDLRDAVAQEKTRQDAAVKDLDTKVSYSKNPRLEAELTVLGLIGDESSYTTAGGGMGGGRGGFGGGGFGGGGRGGRGGRGGGAGGNAGGGAAPGAPGA